MPVKPGPYVLYCRRCKWRKVFAPQSDVIFAGQIPEQCPRCHSALDSRAANCIEAGYAELINKLKRLRF